MTITLYSRNDVTFQIVFDKNSMFHTRLILPNLVFTYRNPLKNIKLALEELAKVERS